MFKTRILSVLRELYVRTFSSRRLSFLNDLLLQFALKARGYNNYDDVEISGERYFIDRILRKIDPRVCVDVGANVGKYTSNLLSLHSNTCVYAFEPLAEPFSELASMKRKYGERLIVVQKGVGQSNETLPLYYDEDATSLASFIAENKIISFISNDKSVDIEVITLDRFFSELGPVEQIDFIKIDVEGFEYEVLCGAQEIIKTYKPKMIQIEHNIYHMQRGQTISSFAALMRDYDLFQMLPGRLVKRDAQDPFSNIFCFSNFVFVRNDLSGLISP